MRTVELDDSDREYLRMIEREKSGHRFLHRAVRAVCYGVMAVAAYLLTVAAIYMVAELIKS